MERYSLIIVTDETSPIRRFEVAKTSVRRLVYALATAALLLLAGFVDYVRVRIDQVELDRLRVETAEQRAKIDSFDSTVAEVKTTLDRVRDFERKVRTIANLPGSAAAGGADVVEVGPEDSGDLTALEDLSGQGEGEADPVHTSEPLPVEPGAAPLGGPQAGAAVQGASAKARAGAASDRVRWLQDEARRLGAVADQRRLSLDELLGQLEDKHQRLAASPAVWPAEGWLTSRFGTRISPFTGKRQFHSGIDIAGAVGTEVLATADGRVVFAGRKGPMGNTVIIDHGWGIRTHYGHNAEVDVKVGQSVSRGTRVARLGNTGRSTGPHLHYAVEVGGKTVNPLDYILD